MKKWKLLLLSVAIATGIGGAFATTKCQICEYYEQYRLYNGSYVSAGTYGVDFICINSAGVCTYYKPSPSSPYYVCRTGQYFPIPTVNK